MKSPSQNLNKVETKVSPTPKVQQTNSKQENSPINNQNNTTTHPEFPDIVDMIRRTCTYNKN